jgi:hypothetical protein
VHYENRLFAGECPKLGESAPAAMRLRSLAALILHRSAPASGSACFNARLMKTNF